jgi:hypothetical protein
MFWANYPLMRSLSSYELEASMIQQNVHWWISKENVAQFQAQLKDRPNDIRRPMIEPLINPDLKIRAALPKVTRRFLRGTASTR